MVKENKILATVLTGIVVVLLATLNYLQPLFGSMVILMAGIIFTRFIYAIYDED